MNNENVVFVKWRKEGGDWRKVLKLRRPPVTSGKEPRVSEPIVCQVRRSASIRGDYINAARPGAFELGSLPKAFGALAIEKQNRALGTRGGV
jgi:hypothetical protein